MYHLYAKKISPLSEKSNVNSSLPNREILLLSQERSLTQFSGRLLLTPLTGLVSPCETGSLI